VGTEDMCRGRHILSKPGAISSPIKKKRALRALDTTGAVRKANVSRATEDTCQNRHILSKPTKKTDHS